MYLVEEARNHACCTHFHGPEQAHWPSLCILVLHNMFRHQCWVSGQYTLFHEQKIFLQSCVTEQHNSSPTASSALGYWRRTFMHLVASFQMLIQYLKLIHGLSVIYTHTLYILYTDYGLDGPGIKSRRRRDFLPVQTCPGTHPASCTMGTISFSWLNCGRGVLLTTHPLLVPRSWKSGAIPLPNLWATPGF